MTEIATGKGGEKMKELVKSVKIGKTVYKVRIEEDVIIAEETTYPLSGYGNNYGTGYSIDLGYSKGWAKVEIYCWNSTWATRGHGMTDSWTEAVGYIRKGEAKKFREVIMQKLKEAEDGTPEVKEVFDKIKMKVEDATSEDYY